MNNHTDCPFCRENNKLGVTVIAETPQAYLVPAFKKPGNYLIIPAIHTESLDALPNDWWQSVKEMLAKVPSLEHYNISVNIGANAGQSLSHVHFWVVPRAAGKASSGKGLLALVNSADISG